MTAIGSEKDQFIKDNIPNREMVERIRKARKAFPMDETKFDELVQQEVRFKIMAKESLENLCPLEMHAAIAKALDLSLHWVLFGRVVTDRDRQAENAFDQPRDPRD